MAFITQYTTTQLVGPTAPYAPIYLGTQLTKAVEKALKASGHGFVATVHFAAQDADLDRSPPKPIMEAREERITWHDEAARLECLNRGIAEIE